MGPQDVLYVLSNTSAIHVFDTVANSQLPDVPGSPFLNLVSQSTIAADDLGNVFVIDSNRLVYRVTPEGVRSL